MAPVWALLLREPLAARGARVADLRKEARSRLGDDRGGGLHVGRGDLARLLFVGERVFRDGPSEDRVAELLPPFGVGEVARLFLLVAEGAGVSTFGRK